MLKYIRISVTFIVTAASLVFMVPAACSSPVPPRNISQVEQTAETKDPGDSCLWNQFVNPNLTCENCTFCPQGTEHSPNEQCGYGSGTKTTCTPCAERFFQMGEGYTGLVCRRCVTCYPGVEYLQNCTTTQDAECGPCPPGEYYLSPNICFECKHDPSHADCPQPPIIKPSTASPNQSAPTLPSSVPLPESTAPVIYTTPPPLSSQAHNTSNNFDANGHVLPSKSPEESGPLIPTPAPANATPAPAGATPAPAGATPAPAGATPAPAGATPAPAGATSAPAGATPVPAGATPAPANATPAPAGATPACAIATPAPAIATPAPVSDLLQGASNPGDQPAASLPTDVSNTETSLPGALCSDEAQGGGHDAWYHPNHVPGSPDSAKDNFVFEYDDGSMSLPKPLVSNEEALTPCSEYHD
ncbi:nascent polypeptide-associated complex subunit alpha, muscle-specific form [Strongylocentrotus purpuratus]|uniref:TNFR-Cys domain-containing protein n=1 Tax=Strongylocentrotus purpuratus TaxID=7668 RepID=A0A7M7NGD6_STRPU|nr:nascent polypeptide-associated complex subunit alpha, muscle-specific form [Strongylocentrotus purpuratus]